MSAAYRVYRRKGVYYSQDNETGKQKSFKTKNRDKAARLLNAKNEAAEDNT
jgi:hypothetical protein